MKWMRSGVLAVLGALGMTAARADSWVPPCPEAYASPQGQWRLVVVPARSATFDCRRADRIRLGAGRPRSWNRARGTLERLDRGLWRSVWQAQLVNETSPNAAAVSNDGRVATFDDWGGVDGSRVVVLYDQLGHQIRQLALTDFLPKPYVHMLPRTISSIYWGAKHAFSADGEQLILQVRVPSADPDALLFGDEPPKYVQLVLDARTGAVIPPQGAAWEAALSIANQADAVRCADEKTALAAFLAKLSPPAREDELKRYEADGRDAMGACGPPPPYRPRAEPASAD